MNLLKTRLALILGSISQASFASCTEPLLPPTDLTPYIHQEDLLGIQMKPGKWLLGTGSEGSVFRILDRENRQWIVEKHYIDPTLAALSFPAFQFYRELQQSAFEVLSSANQNGLIIALPWIKGVSLDKVLSNSKIPTALKERIRKIYREKLVKLLQQISENHPEHDFDVFYDSHFQDVVDQFVDSDHLHFEKLRDLLRKDSPVKRFMIRITPQDPSEIDDPDFDGRVLEPKTDNIVIDPKTWQMTWIDPN